MSKYTHDPAPSQKAKEFIKWCADNIADWPDDFISCARFIGSKNKWWKKNVTWRNHHQSLSHAWAVCTKRQWMEARHDRL